MPPTDVVIRARNLGKRYRLGVSRNAYQTLRDSISGLATVPRRLLTAVLRGGSEGGLKEDFWALREFDLDVKRGEVLGVIGRNGSGKTTLLKIFSKITEPTTGRVELRGRVGSLLEVGSGFHPELSGRENIHLNAAILGMRRAELNERFDDIVSFAEVEEFLDTPVKRYSSGMYVRLAFAVAAYLDPEILLVDEVLAVGDVDFQRRCLGKMDEVARGGRTVIFVSHSMATVENLCGRGVVIDSGRKVFDGPVRDAISVHLEGQETLLRKGLTTESRRSGTGKILLQSVHFETPEGRPISIARSGDDIVLVFGYRKPEVESIKNIDVGFSINALSGQPHTIFYSSYKGKMYSVRDEHGEFRCRIDRLPLAPGRYRVGGRLLVGGVESDWPIDGLGVLDVESGDFYGSGHPGFGSTAPILVDGSWI